MYHISTQRFVALRLTKLAEQCGISLEDIKTTLDQLIVGDNEYGYTKRIV